MNGHIHDVPPLLNAAANDAELVLAGTNDAATAVV